MVNKCLERARRWWLPQSCLRCESHADADFCEPCRNTLPWLKQACRVCAAPLPAVGVCGVCQRQPPAFGTTVALFRYAPPIDGLIWQLKYHQRLSPARVLGALLAARAAALPRPDVLVPTPLHPSRLRARGYNQAAEIARTAGKALGIPVNRHVLVRTRATPSQTDLPHAARRANVRNAFAVREPIGGRHIAVVDDVMTTGATADAMARCLRRAGAAAVSMWVIARA